VVPGGTARFVLPFTAGFALPTAGLLSNSRDLTIAIPGVVKPTAIASSPAVSGTETLVPYTPTGSFLSSSLSFGMPRTSTVSALHLRFTPTMALREFESVSLHLANFSGPAIVMQDALGGASGGMFFAVFSNECPGRTLTLTLRKGEGLAAFQPVEIVVPETAMITLPDTGVRFGYTLHPAPFTLHPTPYTRPTPYTLLTAPYTLHPTLSTPHPTPHTLRPTPYTLHTTHLTRNPTHYTRYTGITLASDAVAGPAAEQAVADVLPVTPQPWNPKP